MTNSKHWLIYRLLLIADLAALLLAFLFAIRFVGHHEMGLRLSELLAMRFSLGNVMGGVAMIFIWVLVLQRHWLYRPRKLRIGLLEEAGVIVRATGIGSLILAAAGLFLRLELFTPSFFVVFWPSVALLTLTLRRLQKTQLKRLHLGDKNQRNVLVVGTNDIACEYGHMVEANSELGFHLLGYLDDYVHEPETSARHLGSLSEFPDLLRRLVVDEVVIAMPVHSCSEAIQKIIDTAHEQGILVRFPLSQLFNGLSSNKIWRVSQEAWLSPSGIPIVDIVVYSGHRLGGRYLLKRLFDFTAATACVILISPILLLAALLTAISSGLPVLFVQDRYGYNGRVFKLYKFRTMVKNADAMQAILRAQNERDGAAFKMKNDPRVTKVGKWLRKTSIDELPQLFNVIKGEMSLVGPRPLPLSDYERITNISHLRRRSVLPGITGPWQISGRDNISFDEWMKMDLDYIDNWRLSTDLKIIFSTIPVVLFGKGAS